jgi:predicted nucleic acid-binding protein
MMTESHLSSPSDRIVADTSAIINLNATQCAADILGALPERLIIVDVAAGELEDGRKNGRPDVDMLDGLRKAGLVEIDGLGDAGEAVFEQLVVGPASETLDDGEAATIAYAVEHSLSIVVDDTKARRICREKYSRVQIRSSVELFRHSAIHRALGQDRLASAVLNALQIGRMRVLPEHIPWVVGLIGDKNASTCRSIPERSRQSGLGRR